MAKVTVLGTYNLRAFADHAGSVVDGQIGFRPDILELEAGDVTQPALDAALITYAAGQVAIDSAFVQAEIDVALDVERDKLDNEKILKAFAELLVDEFNILRALHALPDRTFAQLRTAIRNKVI